MFDKPVINVGYNPPGLDPAVLNYLRYYSFDHYRPVVESGAVQVAKSPTQMEELLRQALVDPGRGQAERRALVHRMFEGMLDGRCGERMAQLLSALAAAGRRNGSGTR